MNNYYAFAKHLHRERGVAKYQFLHRALVLPGLFRVFKLSNGNYAVRSLAGAYVYAPGDLQLAVFLTLWPGEVEEVT